MRGDFDEDEDPDFEPDFTTMMTCPACKDSPVAGTVWIKMFIDDGMGSEVECARCHGAGVVFQNENP